MPFSERLHLPRHSDRYVGSIHSRRYALFIERLIAARIEAGLTQEQASKAMGMQQSLISRCEAGQRRIDILEAARFAELYGLSSLDQLLPIKPKKKKRSR